MSALLPEDQETLGSAPPSVWEGLRGAQLLMTGGTGFVGTWILASLDWANRELGLGASATVISRDPSSFVARQPWAQSAPWLGLVRGDVREMTPTRGRYTHVIVGAATADAQTAAQEPLALMETILEGGARTLRAATGARAALLLSSGAVYGLGGERLERIPEDFEGRLDRLDPAYAYHEAKRAVETMAAAAGAEFGLEVKIARLFAFVGPWLPGDRHFAIGNFIRDGLVGGPIVVQGDGSPERSYLYAADMVVWLLAVLVKGTTSRAYNVGSDRAINMAALAELVAAALPARPEVEVRGTRVVGGGGQRYVPNVDRVTAELGVEQTVDIEESVARTIRWLQARESAALA